MKLHQLKAFIKKIGIILKSKCGENHVGYLEPILEKLMPTKATEGSIVIKLGKVNFVVREQFVDGGKPIDEIIEKLIVEKSRQSA